MHYAAVLGVMPTLAPAGVAGPLTAVPMTTYVWSIAAATALLFAGMLADFTTAHTVYAIAAAVHAWVELPVLILAVSSAAARA